MWFDPGHISLVFAFVAQINVLVNPKKNNTGLKKYNLNKYKKAVFQL